MSDQPAPAPTPSPWILSPGKDLLLFVATPVLILPVVLLLLQGIESRALQSYVLVFGASGHQLPGMIRAYGDRALFRRFRARFIFAPLVVGGTCMMLFMQGAMVAILTIVLLWASWHALMQVYGFLRIYDAKVGAVAPRIARLDLAMVMVWFGGAMVLSDSRVYHIQELFINFGIPPLTTGVLGVMRTTTAVVIGLVTLAYLVTQVIPGPDGQRVNPVKHLLMFTAIGFWWFAHFVTKDVLLGLVMFEVFHDVQYLAIVWIFNRRRVDGDPAVGGFTRFLFRNSWGMMGLYLGLVLAYGGLIPVSTQFELGDQGIAVIEALVATSALVHYYFDGFIWKIREQSTRKALGVADGSGAKEKRVPWHAVKWLLFLVPCAVAWYVGEDKKVPALDKAQALVASTPDSARAQLQLGEALNISGRYLESVVVLTRSLELLPNDAKTEVELARARLFAGRKLWHEKERDRAKDLLKKAYERIPEYAVHNSNEHGLRAFKEKRVEEAIEFLHMALFMQPDTSTVHINLAQIYRETNRIPLALKHAKRAAALDPQNSEVAAMVRALEGR